MAERKRIGIREVKALKPGEIIWDSVVRGFAARRQKGETVTYILKFRTQEGRQRWHTVGRHGTPWTPDEARDEALRLLGKVVDGADPAADKQTKRNAKTVTELCDLYLKDAMEGRVLRRDGKPKKASTLSVDNGRIERHIKPLIGRLAVAAVTTEDIDCFMHDVAQGKSASRAKTAKMRGLARVKGGRTAATRAVGLLGAIFTYAVRHRMRKDNPVRGVVRFADDKRDRRLSDDEYISFGEALRNAELAHIIWPAAVAASRFLALTGWRMSEALELRWDVIDFAKRTATLRDSKIGKSVRPLSHAACDVLRSVAAGSTLVFPATRGKDGTVMSGFKRMFKKIATLGHLPPDVTPNTLRHSFMSLGNDLSFTDLTIGACCGHKGRTITSHYIHFADSLLLAAADAIANKTSELMGELKVAAKVIELHAAN